jgi:hypothetical protein
MFDLDDTQRVALRDAFSGVFGKSFSIGFVYHLDVIKTKLQLPDHDYTSAWDAYRRVFAQGGISALYAGVGSEYVKGAVSSFVYVYFYA